MRTRSKLILAALTASLLMGLAVNSASAGNLRTMNMRFRITWLTLRIADLNAGGIALTCRVTLEGSFHSATIRKIRGALLGAITRGIVDSGNCRGTNEPTRVTILQETLPWHLTYETFFGVLPNITEIGVLLRRYDFQISATILGITLFCLYLDGGLPEENQMGFLTRNIVSSVITPFAFGPERRAKFLRGTPFPEACPAFAVLSGPGEVFLLGTTNRIMVTLI